MTSNHRIALVLGGLVALATAPAHGTLLLDTSVTDAFSPSATTTGTEGNDMPGVPSTLYFGQLSATLSGFVDFYYVGKEAGFTNQFQFGDQSYSTQGKANSFQGPNPLIGSLAVTAGDILDFAFCTDGGASVGSSGRCVSNGDAASLIEQYNHEAVGGYRSIGFAGITGHDPATGVPLFAESLGLGDLWMIFFDDSGAGNDDDFDDMVIEARFRAGSIVTVPEPATLGLLGLGLFAGAAALRRTAPSRR